MQTPSKARVIEVKERQVSESPKISFSIKHTSYQIAQLKWQLQAQAAKSSLLQSRLTSTLDAMDALKLQYEHDLNTERQAKDKARERLQRFMEYASTIEQERDEYRKDLQTVVEKGGSYLPIDTHTSNIVFHCHILPRLFILFLPPSTSCD